MAVHPSYTGLGQIRLTSVPAPVRRTRLSAPLQVELPLPVHEEDVPERPMRHGLGLLYSTASSRSTTRLSAGS